MYRPSLIGTAYSNQGTLWPRLSDLGVQCLGCCAAGRATHSLRSDMSAPPVVRTESHKCQNPAPGTKPPVTKLRPNLPKRPKARPHVSVVLHGPDSTPWTRTLNDCLRMSTGERSGDRADAQQHSAPCPRGPLRQASTRRYTGSADGTYHRGAAECQGGAMAAPGRDAGAVAHARDKGGWPAVRTTFTCPPDTTQEM
jgi:hypothetical protein